MVGKPPTVPVGTKSKQPSSGYWMIKTKNGWRFLHRVIKEEQLGRFLKPDERVRIKDGNKDNLDPDNLELEIGGQAALTNRKLALERKKHRLEWKINHLNDELQRTMQDLNELNSTFKKLSGEPTHWRDRTEDLA